MKFLATLRWPLFVWQFLGMAPYGIANKCLLPIKSTKLQCYSGVLLLIHSVVLVIGIVLPSSYVDLTDRMIHLLNDLAAVIIARFLACVIVAESLIKLNKQIDFLRQMLRIDFILRGKLRINIDYKREHFENNLMTGIWIFTWLSCCIIVWINLYKFYEEIDVIFWYWYAPQFLMYSIQYHRLVTYMRLIFRRYKIINEFIEKYHAMQEERAQHFESTMDFKEMSKLKFTDFPKPLLTKSQLQHIRDAYQILYETTNMVNDIFWWSLPLCILMDFHRLLLNVYYSVCVLFLQSEWLLLGVSIIFGGVNFTQIFILAYAGHSTKTEVRSFIFLWQKMYKTWFLGINDRGAASSSWFILLWSNILWNGTCLVIKIINCVTGLCFHF